MTPITLDSFRPFISWIIGALAASFSTYLLEHFHINISPELLEHGKEFLTLSILFIVGKSFAKYFNPGDSASKHLIPVQQEIVREQKALHKSKEFKNVQKVQEEKETTH